MGKRLERFGEVRIIDETNGFGLDFVEKTESRFWSTTLDVGAVSKEGRIWDLYIDRRWEDEKNPRALARKPSFWDACLAREWMWVFQVRLDERERPSCVKEAEVSSSSPFMKTAGQFWLRLREMTACFVLLWLNETRLSLPHFSITVRSWREARLKCFCGVGYRWKHGHLDWMKMRNLGRYHQQRSEC